MLVHHRTCNTHVRKNVEALGRFCARSEGMEPGLLTRSGNAAMIPDESVTIKNECYIKSPVSHHSRIPQNHKKVERVQ